MKVFLATDIRVIESDGRMYMPGQVYYIVKRYYEAFGACTLCSRVLRKKPSDKLMDVTEFIDRVIEVPSLGKSFFPGFKAQIQMAVDEADLVIARLHSIIGMRVLAYAQKRDKKCFAELMGDAWDGLWNHSLVGKLIAPYVFLMTKKVTWNADYALYVTNEFLQKRYPCRNPSVAASNVQLVEVSDDVLNKRIERIKTCDTKSLRLMTTAAVDVRYKGQEFVIKAIPSLNKSGIRVQYLLVGGGEQTYLKEIAKSCGVEDQVVFVGRLPLAEVFELLDTVDIYIQPSLQEGLPRSVIEAMSRGCPAIGARTAGIPELLSPECVVRRKSSTDIAETIIRIANREKMEELAKRNFEEAKEYRNDVLNARREAYFARIKAECDK